MSETKLSIQELKERMKIILLWDYTDDEADPHCLIDTNLKLTYCSGSPILIEKYIHTPPNTLIEERDFYKDKESPWENKAVNYIPFIKGNDDIETTDWHGESKLIDTPKGSSLAVKKIRGYEIGLGCHFMVQGEEFCPCIGAGEILHISEIHKDCQGCDHAGNS